MKFDYITIAGFRAFLGERTLKFPKAQTGFYLMTGKNLVDTDLGSNGAGKSTVFEALTWALTGRTSRGLRAGDIANWDRDSDTIVEVGFDGRKLQRMWNPNGLFLDGEVIQQEELDQVTGFTRPTFLATVMMGQFQQFFFDLTPTQKLKIFSTALGIERWEARSTTAGTRAINAQDDATALERSLVRLRERMRGIAEESARVRNLMDTSAAERDTRKQAYQEELDKATAALRELVKLKANHLSKRVKACDEKEALDRIIIKLDDRRIKIRDSYRELVSKHQTHKKLIDSLKSLKGSCPRCMQPLDSNHRKREIARVRRLATQAAEKAQAVGDRLQIIEAKMSWRSSKADHVEETIKGLDIDLRQVVARENEARATIKSSERLLAQEETIQTSFDNHLKELQHSRATVKAEIQAAKKDLRTAKKKIDAYSYWKNGFKELRLWLVMEALKELEVLTNNQLTDLGLDGWKISFDIERPNKSGGISKGFTVSIRTPFQGETIPWEGWSGGETQRLRIAGALGLSDLICSRNGLSPSLEIWDEPTEHLSDEGVDDLLRFFATRARREKRQVWMIDHRSFDGGEFDRVYRVVKTQQAGSYFAKV